MRFAGAIAPGVGDFVPGMYQMPNTPTQMASSGGRVRYTPRIGEMLPAKFREPENPIRRAMLGMNGCCGGCGMGAIDSSSISGFMGSTVAIGGYEIPMLAIFAAAAFVYLMSGHCEKAGRR